MIVLTKTKEKLFKNGYEKDEDLFKLSDGTPVTLIVTDFSITDHIPDVYIYMHVNVCWNFS